ncbi:MAG: family 78 glycoside hydrolase catalytic domain [Eubacteriales bacterium]|nr:family 78 glycoside hydrolase catalytic domain [Eubacteriales bacterium]
MSCITNLQINHLYTPIGIDPKQIRITWSLKDIRIQKAFQIQLTTEDGKDLLKTNRIPEQTMYYTLTEDRPYKKKIFVNLMIWDEKDVRHEAAAFFETGPCFSDLSAKWIDPEIRRNGKERTPASYLRKKFTVDNLGEARIYATAHGIFDIYLNGNHFDDALLMPGITEYNKRLQLMTLDCTKYLKQGENEIIVTLGDGRYRGSASFDLTRAIYGDDLALYLELEINNTSICKSDETWQASQSGPLGINDMMLGEEFDSRKNISDWHAVTVKKYNCKNFIYPEAAPVRKMEYFKATKLVTPNGEIVLDFGENIAGFVKFSIDADDGDYITMIHGETLDEKGNFTIENYKNPSKKDVNYQQVEYICKNGRNEYYPTKTYFGFRYVKIISNLDIDPDNFTAIAIYTDMKQVGYFNCGNKDINQLFKNALRSMKGNFVDIPTDCPTREKDGWSGDAQAFVHTAMYLMDCYGIYSKWTKDLAETQKHNGKLECVAPRRTKPHTFSVNQLMDGSVGWGDAIEIVPYFLEERYGDNTLAKKMYGAMKKWNKYLLHLARKSRKQHREKIPKDLWPYYVDHGFLWGEWLEPGQNYNEYMKDLLKNGDPEVSTAYLAYSSDILAYLANELGFDAEEKYFKNVAEKAKAAYSYVALTDGRVTGNRQCKYVRPVSLNLMSEEKNGETIKNLVTLLNENGNKINTGFLTTHNLCRALTDYGYSNKAYDVLLQEECPGWLYAVKHGATSIWETWDGVREDGSVHDSLNHYSYGAIVGWLFDSVCGIRVEHGKIKICPHPDRRLGNASGRYESAFGIIASGWEYTDDGIHYEIEIPGNCEAEVVLPGEKMQILRTGNYVFDIHENRG